MPSGKDDVVIDLHFALAKTAAVQTRLINAALLSLKLDAGSWEVLRIISSHPDHDGAEIARLLRRDTGALSRLLRHLSAKGFVIRQPCLADGRRLKHRLTDLGRSTLEKGDQEIRRLECSDDSAGQIVPYLRCLLVAFEGTSLNEDVE